MKEKVDENNINNEVVNEIQSSNSTLQEKIDALSPEEKERLAASLRLMGETLSKARIELPEIKIPDSVINVFEENAKIIDKSYKTTSKTIINVLSEIRLSLIVDNITKPQKGTGYYQGLEIEKYRKIRQMKAKDLSEALGIDKSTLSKYSSGSIDVPASKLVEISEILNVSLDLLLKMKNRELRTGYIGKEIYLYDFDYKKKEYVPTSVAYSLDKNLEELKDKNLIAIRHKKPIYELGLPKDTILFITEGADAIALGTTKKVAVCIQEKVGDTINEYFSYVEPLKSQESDKDYSSVINYTYKKDGETYVCRLSKLQQMVKFVIHKAVIDF